MGIEKVRIGSTTATAVWSFIIIGADVGEQFLIDVVGLFRIAEPCPEIDAPSRAPSGGLVAFLNERLPAGFQQFVFCEVVAGIEPDEVALVAMKGIKVIPVVSTIR